MRKDISSRKLVEQLSVTDRLTGIANRHALEDSLRAEEIRAERYGDTFAVLILDIDHFKSVNDTHGHLVGDVVLREIAECIGSRLRETDRLGRWGGEEFMVILPRTESAGAMIVAEEIRSAIAGRPAGPGLAITASIGVSAWDSDESGEAVVGRADAALYRAKRAGRNRVEQA